jgi:hypothetical protein
MGGGGGFGGGCSCHSHGPPLEPLNRLNASQTPGRKGKIQYAKYEHKYAKYANTNAEYDKELSKYAEYDTRMQNMKDNMHKFKVVI